MSDLTEEILNLQLSEDIFKGIRFFISGDVHEKIIDLLKSGGAERLNYFSEYVTHLFVGDNPEENDIIDANDLYDKPALTPKWVVICADLKKLVSTKPYLYVPGGKLLSNLVFCFSNVREDRNYLWALITYNGGIVQLNLNRNCNYLVTTDTSSIKYEKAESLGSDFIKIVTPDWVVETVRNKSLADAVLFHPRLINWPKPVKHESTTAITGFEPEQTENVEKTEEKPISDSTQALLEKLKQRMPWNQPSTPKTTSSSDPVAPPNVVAPSFIQKSPNQQQQQSPRAQLPQAPSQQSQQITPQSPVSSSFPQIPRSPSTSLSNQPIPRSIVHHTPTQQNSFQQQQPQNPLNISRLIGQPQTRPNIQQLRGQIGQSQLHQQLLQQRMQQNQQNIQRNSAGQITVQQQLLQQQLVQGQRQLLQNQLNQGQMLQQQQQGGSNQQTIGQNPQQIGSTQHLSQLTQQQLAQLQQQQLQLKQNQQLQQQQQIQLNQNQQLIQNQVLQQQQNQLREQQQNQLNQQQQNQLNQQQQNQLNQQQQNQLNQQQQNQLNQQQQNQISQQQQNQLSQQQQIQLSQSQTFVQQNLSQHITSQQTQQLLQQKQQFLSQQQSVTSQQQIIQNQPNLAVQQQQFVGQNFTQNQNVNQEISQQNMQQQQQNVTQQQSISQQLSAQALNQQLNSQNLGQQLNQQQLNQQLNQQQLNQQNQLSQQLNQQNLLSQQLGQQNQLGQQLNQQEQLSQQLNQQNQINQQLNQINQQNQLNRQNINQQALEQGLTQNINEALNQQLTQGLSQQLQQQQLNRQNLQQQQQQLNPQQIQVQQQQSLNQQNLQQQQITQINQQISSGLPQQVVRAQFQQQGNISQQILINQQSPQNSSPQRAQINQHLWAQQPSQVPGQQIIRHPVNVVQQAGPRVQWSPNPQQGNVVPQRQFIQLDARTHNELQKMPPEQQALFVAKLQKQRQLLKQVQQRGGGGSHILIRGNVPPGLTTQQQVQWLQQQAKQQGIVLPPNIQQQNITPGTLTQPGLAQNIQHAPGLSPINQNNTQFIDPTQQQQIQLRQYRLQQLQLQREQAQKNHLAQQQQGAIQQPSIVRPIGQPQVADTATNPPQVQDANIQHSLVVNAKTKTALANMLSIKLQSGGSSIGVQRPETLPEQSAAGTLRLMTAQHNAALNAKPQEIIALQRRTINGPNGEIIKPPGAQQLPITPTNEPPKLQYCPKAAQPVQHKPGPFYGHNPNLKLSDDPRIVSDIPQIVSECAEVSQHIDRIVPPDLFLLGCIFVVVELESFLEETIPGWQQKIEKHGGEVEKQYCSRVTHVLCETQRHGVVMQALRDCKRCVTILWLSDIMNRKVVLPPWTALHLPNIYLDTAPASKHLISISGFEGNDRNRVKHMIKYTGAKCTTYFSKHNTLLISAKAEGKKCSYAKKWQIPVVNVQWLTDVMLGNFAAMNQMDHQIYQQFPDPPNFFFDPKSVPNLMVAWKAPINISQESYERVKRSASPVALPRKVKKPKIESTDENDNINEDHVTNFTHRILFSMVTNAKEMQKMVGDLGGCVAKDHSDFTHLVMPYLARSNKLFFAIAKGAQVVSEQWLKDSHASNQFLPENNYSLNSKDFNYEYKCDIDQTLLTRNRNRLFEGKFFFVTPSVFPSKKIIVELIQCCGGIVERIRRSSAQIEATSINSPYSYFIITHENDLHLVADLLKNKKDKMKIVCNVELVFSAILKQTFEVEPYAVCVL